MKYSRNQITKAGEILVTSKSQDEVDKATALINDWRASHMHPLNEMKNYLAKLLDQNDIKPVLISQRLKRMSSISYKLDLNPQMGLGGMQDIGGYRAVLNGTEDLMKLHSLLELDEKYDLLKINDYVATPKVTGYRSIHYVYEFSSVEKEFDGLRIELQIRTKLQHIWATAVETVGAATKTSLKSGQGADVWQDFFKITSSLFSIQEGLPVIEEYSSCKIEKLKIECERISKKIRVIDILNGLGLSLKIIKTGKIKGDYHLIFISLKEESVRIKGYPKKNFNQALEDYASIEKSITESEGAVVLVNLDSYHSLQEAYPSYFLDTSEFIAAIEKINEDCKYLKKDNAQIGVNNG